MQGIRPERVHKTFEARLTIQASFKINIFFKKHKWDYDGCFARFRFQEDIAIFAGTRKLHIRPDWLLCYRKKQRNFNAHPRGHGNAF